MTLVDPPKIICKYYDVHSRVYEILTVHSELVAKKAMQLGQAVSHLMPDFKFIEEAAMLHDIGIFRTSAPGIDCHGDKPYIQHGILGRELLEEEGLPEHALVCERHVGVGLTAEEIVREKLPLPARDMLPVTLEEKVICFADCFYGKNPKNLYKEKSINEISQSMRKFGAEARMRFEEFVRLFNLAESAEGKKIGGM